MRARARLLGFALAALSLLAAVPVAADPLGVVDIEAMVPAGGLEWPLSRPDGTVLYLDEGRINVICDPTRGRNLADLVIELQMAQTVLMACPGLANDARHARVRDLRALALPRYAVRAGVAEDAVRAAFARRALAEVELVGRCGVTANDIVSDVTDPWFETRLREAMEADRMPARTCPRELQ